MLTIVTLIKNENLYLEEWIQYHFSLGIDKIIVVEDTDSVSHKDITDKYANITLYSIDELIAYHPLRRSTILRDIANYFVVELLDETDWLAFIDADEFIMTYGDLNKELDKYKDECGVRMKWCCLNANGHFNRPDGLSLINYTQECNIYNTDWESFTYKSIGNVKKSPLWKDPHEIVGSVIINNIWCNHYITRSFEDYCIKIYERGDVYHRIYRSFNKFFSLNPEFNKDEALQYVINKYGDSKELIANTNESVAINLRPRKSTRPFVKIFDKAVELGAGSGRVLLKAIASHTCGILHLDDPYGLYGIILAGNSIYITFKNFNGGKRTPHVITIKGLKGGLDKLTIIRHGNWLD